MSGPCDQAFQQYFAGFKAGSVQELLTTYQRAQSLLVAAYVNRLLFSYDHSICVKWLAHVPQSEWAKAVSKAGITCSSLQECFQAAANLTGCPQGMFPSGATLTCIGAKCVDAKDKFFSPLANWMDAGTAGPPTNLNWCRVFRSRPCPTSFHTRCLPMQTARSITQEG